MSQNRKIAWYRFCNGNVFAVAGHWLSARVACETYPIDDDHLFDEFLDGLSEAAVGSGCGLTNITYDMVAVSGTGPVWQLGGNIAELFDDEDASPRRITVGSKAWRKAMATQYGLPPAWVDHAVHSLTDGDLDYGEEGSVALASGLDLRFPRDEATPTYVRLVIPGEQEAEAAYWIAEELGEAPGEVLGVLLRALSANTPEPA